MVSISGVDDLGVDDVGVDDQQSTAATISGGGSGPRRWRPAAMAICRKVQQGKSCESWLIVLLQSCHMDFFVDLVSCL